MKLRLYHVAFGWSDMTETTLPIPLPAPSARALGMEILDIFGFLPNLVTFGVVECAETDKRARPLDVFYMSRLPDDEPKTAPAPARTVH